MSPRGKRFAEEYAKSLNAEQSALAAGYAPKTARHSASRLLADVGIRRAVNEVQAQHAERVAVDHVWVLTRLIANAERAMQAEAVTDREGNETGEYRYEGHVANRALELIGKHLGMFDDLTTTLVMDVTKLSSQEREAEIDRLLAKRTRGISSGGPAEGAGGGEEPSI